MRPEQFSILLAIVLSGLNIINVVLILKDKANAPGKEQDRRIALVEEDVRDLKRKQDTSYTDIDNLKSANKILMKSMSALLSHGIEGNNVNEMKLAREELNEYLFDRYGGKHMKIDWKRKLTSRKFWVAIAGFVTGVVVFIKSPTSSPEAITSLIMTTGTLVAYIIGEGLADSSTTENYYLDDEK
jgi:hypothetical protein